LNFTLLYLWCADYTNGSVSGTVGNCNNSWSSFITKTKSAIDGLVASTTNILRPDGVNVIDTLYLNGEVMVGAKANEGQFLKDLYPYFLSKTNAAGLNGSLYFNTDGTEAYILQSDYTDMDYPILNNHRTLYWVYRSTKFMQDNGLPLPSSIDFSFYPAKINSTYPILVNKLIDDVKSVYPGMPFRIAETYYPPNINDRQALGQAYANGYLNKGGPNEVTFWTTPNGGNDGSNQGFPFDFSSFKIQQTPSSTPTITPSPTSSPSPTATTNPPVVGDLNSDGIVNSFDWAYMNSKWYTNDPVADLNKDGIVNTVDFSMMNANWLK
jgi:hypothetical protein